MKQAIHKKYEISVVQLVKDTLDYEEVLEIIEYGYGDEYE